MEKSSFSLRKKKNKDKSVIPKPITECETSVDHGNWSSKYQWDDYKNHVKITETQFNEIVEVFHNFDVNHDGVISRKEFYSLWAGVGLYF